jgi:hypothetical protein
MSVDDVVLYEPATCHVNKLGKSWTPYDIQTLKKTVII